MEAVLRVPPLAPFGRRPIIVDGHPCRATAIFCGGAGREEDGGHCIHAYSCPKITDDDGRPCH